MIHHSEALSTNNLKKEELNHVVTGQRLSLSGNVFTAKSVTKGDFCHFAGSGNKSGVTCFSNGSAFRMRKFLRECIAEYGYFITLTYPAFFPTDGRGVKEHLRRFIQEYKRKVERDNDQQSYESFSAFWFLEFQQRGAPHFHIFVTHDCGKQWISKRWYEIVGTDDDRHLRAGTNVQQLKAGRAGTVSYAQKYANKQSQKDVPEDFTNVGRFWGVSGLRKRVSAAIFVPDNRMKTSGILSAKSDIKSVINRAIKKGTAQVYVAKEGVFCARLDSLIDQKVIRSLLWAIGMMKSTVDLYEVDDEFELMTYRKDSAIDYYEEALAKKLLDINVLMAHGAAIQLDMFGDCRGV